MQLPTPSQQQSSVDSTKDPFQKVHKLRSDLRTAFANLNRVAVESIRRETASTSDGSGDSSTEEHQSQYDTIRLSLESFLSVCDEMESSLQMLVDAEKLNAQMAKCFPLAHYRPLVDSKVDQTAADPKLTHEFQLFAQQQAEIMKSIKANLAETLMVFSGSRNEEPVEVIEVPSSEDRPKSLPVLESNIKTEAVIDDEIGNMEIGSDQVEAVEDQLLHEEENRPEIKEGIAYET